MNTNGIISFGGQVLTFRTGATPPIPSILPFWIDINVRAGGSIFYRETSNATLLEKARLLVVYSYCVNSVFSSEVADFVPVSLFIATWDSVAPFDSSLTGFNTFQVVLVTDGATSFVLYFYEDLQWGDGAQIGFNAGDGERQLIVTETVSEATSNFDSSSNIEVPGIFTFRVDGE